MYNIIHMYLFIICIIHLYLYLYMYLYYILYFSYNKSFNTCNKTFNYQQKKIYVIWILYKSKYFNLLSNYNNKDWINWKIDNLKHSVRVKYSKNNSLESNKLIVIYTYNCI